MKYRFHCSAVPCAGDLKKRKAALAGMTLALAVATAALRLEAAEFPLKGIVLWPDEARDHPELNEVVALEFAYLTPSAIVRTPDREGHPVFNWTPLEHLLDDMASRGHQAVLRFRYEYPGETTPEYPGKRGATGVPAYIKSRPDYRETFSPNPGGDGPTWYADWGNKALQDFTIQFFKAFADRYDADSRVAFLEVGFGHWSEYHTHGTPVRLGKNFPSKEFQAAFFRHLAERLKATPWCISIDAAQPEYSDMARDSSLSALPFGLFDDSFMHEEHDIAQGDGYNEKCWNAFGKERWRRAPCGGEISYYKKRDQREFLNPKGLYGVTWEAAAAKYHMTFVVGNDSLAGRFATPGRLREAALATGYDLRLVEAKSFGNSLAVKIANKGVAPLYHDAFATIADAKGAGIVAGGNLRGIQPGETRTLTFAFDGAPPPDAAQRLRLTSPKLLTGAALPLRRD